MQFKVNANRSAVLLNLCNQSDSLILARPHRKVPDPFVIPAVSKLKRYKLDKLEMQVLRLMMRLMVTYDWCHLDPEALPIDLDKRKNYGSTYTSFRINDRRSDHRRC